LVVLTTPSKLQSPHLDSHGFHMHCVKRIIVVTDPCPGTRSFYVIYSLEAQKRFHFTGDQFALSKEIRRFHFNRDRTVFLNVTSTIKKGGLCASFLRCFLFAVTSRSLPHRRSLFLLLPSLKFEPPLPKAKKRKMAELTESVVSPPNHIPLDGWLMMAGLFACESGYLDQAQDCRRHRPTGPRQGQGSLCPWRKSAFSLSEGRFSS
jgi:hypothetical protein